MRHDWNPSASNPAIQRCTRCQAERVLMRGLGPLSPFGDQVYGYRGGFAQGLDGRRLPQDGSFAAWVSGAVPACVETA